MTNQFGIFKDNPSARKIIRSKIKELDEPMNKYNPAKIKMLEEFIGEPSADYREASDVGLDPQSYQINETIA